jgi:hypothetical protein
VARTAVRWSVSLLRSTVARGSFLRFIINPMLIQQVTCQTLTCYDI